ncbi:hypothetical protein ES703_93160 [subsurface metagenome]
MGLLKGGKLGFYELFVLVGCHGESVEHVGAVGGGDVFILAQHPVDGFQASSYHGWVHIVTKLGGIQ